MKKVIMMLAAVFFTLCVWAESLQVPTVAGNTDLTFCACCHAAI